MAVYVVVPVKKLADSKRRLSTVFTPQERRLLTLSMLQDVLSALKASKVDVIAVAGEDSQVEQVAKKYKATYLSANGAALNPAIEQAALWCKAQGASSVLILPADIPLLLAADVNRILDLGNRDGSNIVLSPSSNCGTNALYQTPPNQIPACFGPKSFLNHINEAYQKGINVRLHFAPGLSADIDDVEDLKKLFEIENKSACKRVLQQIMRNNQTAMDFLAKTKNEN